MRELDIKKKEKSPEIRTLDAIGKFNIQKQWHEGNRRLWRWKTSEYGDSFSNRLYIYIWYGTENQDKGNLKP